MAVTFRLRCQFPHVPQNYKHFRSAFKVPDRWQTLQRKYTTLMHIQLNFRDRNWKGKFPRTVELKDKQICVLVCDTLKGFKSHHFCIFPDSLKRNIKAQFLTHLANSPLTTNQPLGCNALTSSKILQPVHFSFRSQSQYFIQAIRSHCLDSVIFKCSSCRFQVHFLLSALTPLPVTFSKRKSYHVIPLLKLSVAPHFLSKRSFADPFLLAPLYLSQPHLLTVLLP